MLEQLSKQYGDIGAACQRLWMFSATERVNVGMTLPSRG